jgi:hypothetical protein
MVYPGQELTILDRIKEKMLTYPQAVKELFYSLFGSSSTNFHAELYFLIGKADPFNKERLRLAYPVEVQVWEDWQASPSQVEFFESFGFKVLA